MYCLINTIMSNTFICRIDRASEYIVRLKLIMRNLASKLCIEPGLLQQLLDNESLYINQIPKDTANVFRVVANAIELTQTSYPSIMRSYISKLREKIKVCAKYNNSVLN